MSQKILITSALLYANGPLHFGHLAGAYLPADIYARYQRLQGQDVLYISGSDEYGVAITLSAEIAKRSPKEHVDHFHEINKNFFKRLDFSFDQFSRTTWDGHSKTTLEFFQDLLKNGYIEKKEEKHLYSKEEKRFLADRYVIGTCPKCSYEKARGDECPDCGASFEANDLINPRSKIHNTSLVLKPSTHWYLRFDAFKDRLIEWIGKKDWKDNVVAFAKHYIDDLRPRAITRDTSWGIKVPLEDAKGKVFYVWFDAPIGYISAAKQWAIDIDQKEKWKDYWLNPDSKLVHFIGKDNIPFHTIFFPAMIMGQDKPYKLPDQVPANEFLLLEGKQFSKSDGWYIDLETFLDTYSTDQLRYTLAANAPESSDSDFSFKDFQMRCNSELVGKFGNLAHRTLVFTKNQCDSKVPAIEELSSIDKNFIREIEGHIDEAAICFNNFRVRKATTILMSLCQIGNAYFDEKKPWVLAKEADKKSQLNTTIALLLECLKSLSLIASPIIPTSAQKLWVLLGNTTSLEKKNWHEIKTTRLKAGQTLPAPFTLFTKIEDEMIEREVAKLGNVQEEKRLEFYPLKEDISFDTFEKMDLRVAQIISCSKVVKSKRLLKLEVDLGFEKRTIVSGIAANYNVDQLIGKKVIIIANIPEATIMGIKSQGMVLAGNIDKSLELPMVQDLPPGSCVN